MRACHLGHIGQIKRIGTQVWFTAFCSHGSVGQTVQLIIYKAKNWSLGCLCLASSAENREETYLSSMAEDVTITEATAVLHINCFPHETYLSSEMWQQKIVRFSWNWCSKETTLFLYLFNKAYGRGSYYTCLYFWNIASLFWRSLLTLGEPHCFSVSPPAWVHWPKETHNRQKFTVQKKGLIVNWPLWRQRAYVLQTQLAEGV